MYISKIKDKDMNKNPTFSSNSGSILFLGILDILKHHIYFSHVQSAKMILVHPKCEIFFGALSNCFFTFATALLLVITFPSPCFIF